VRRVFEVLAVILLVTGVELATGAVSFGLNQVFRVYFQLVAGTETDVSVTRFFVGGGMITLGVGYFALEVWARAYSGFVGLGQDCPHCGIHAKRVKRRTAHKVLGWVTGTSFTHRKCEKCGWHGLTASP